MKQYDCEECGLSYEVTEPDFGLCSECTAEADLKLAREEMKSTAQNRTYE